MNRIVVEFCEEDRKRIDELIAFAGSIVGEQKQYRAFLERGLLAAAPAADHPADAPTTHFEVPAEAPAPAPAPEVKPVSLGEFQKAIVTRCAESAAMKAKVQTLVHKYAPSVSEIPEGKRPEVLAALANL